MEPQGAVAALGALAHDTRLAVYRLLVQRGPDGLSAGLIAQALALPPSSLTFHLQQLTPCRADHPAATEPTADLCRRFRGDERADGLPDRKLLRRRGSALRAGLLPRRGWCGEPARSAIRMRETQMDESQIKQMVRARYGGIAAASEISAGCAPAASSCCGPTDRRAG